MNRKFRIIFFAVGLAAFLWCVHRFGVDQLVSNIQRAGWTLLYVIFVWLVIYLLNTLSWKLLLGSRPNSIPLRELFMVTVSGFVLNYLTPVVALGGEPYKVKVLSGSMDTTSSLSLVILYRMVHLLGHMLLLLTGVITALLLLSLPDPVTLALIIAGLAILGVILLTMSGHRNGIFQRLERLCERIPFLKRCGPLLKRYEADIREMDETIVSTYHNSRRTLYLAILLEYASRICMGIEVYLILHGVGVETTISSALFLYVTYSIVINILFFIPLNLGAREGGLSLGLGALALPPLLGIYLGVVMRIREFFWILLGLLFILLTKRKGQSAPVHV